jgi:hypothetical protein
VAGALRFTCRYCQIRSPVRSRQSFEIFAPVRSPLKQIAARIRARMKTALRAVSAALQSKGLIDIE